MIRQAFVVLGIGVIVAGFAPIAEAQSANPSSSEARSVTLSGESLQTVESRTVREDYPNFFSGSSSDSQDGSATDVGRLTESPSSSPLNDIVGDDVEVIFGDTLNSSEDNPTSFSPPGELGDTQRVKVQFLLGQ